MGSRLTGCWGDANQASDHALNRPSNGSLPKKVNIFQHHPSLQACSGADMRVQHGQGSINIY